MTKAGATTADDNGASASHASDGRKAEQQHGDAPSRQAAGVGELLVQRRVERVDGDCDGVHRDPRFALRGLRAAAVCGIPITRAPSPAAAAWARCCIAFITSAAAP